MLKELTFRLQDCCNAFEKEITPPRLQLSIRHILLPAKQWWDMIATYVKILFSHIRRILNLFFSKYLICNAFVPHMNIYANPCIWKLGPTPSQWLSLNCIGKAPGRFMQYPYKMMDTIKFQFIRVHNTNRRIIFINQFISNRRSNGWQWSWWRLTSDNILGWIAMSE